MHLRGEAEAQAFVDEFGRGALQAWVDAGMYGGIFLENARAWLAAHPA